MTHLSLDVETQSRLKTKAVQVLRDNDLGDSTKPAPRLYPHQWLWDSCFIAIGLRHLDPDRARQEVLSLFRGQWRNGMLPHIIFHAEVDYHAGADMWASNKVAAAPKSPSTSGIAQPPVVAEAVVRVGEALPEQERLAFYGECLPHLIDYHLWLYRERDPRGTGLVALIHPWEVGNEDTPAWSSLMPAAAPDFVKEAMARGDEKSLDAKRPDLKHAPLEARPKSVDFFTFYHLQELVRDHNYELEEVLKDSRIPVLQDVLYNAILIRANELLERIATELGEELPGELKKAIAKTPRAFEGLYKDGHYWSRNYRDDNLLIEPAVSGLMALYAGTISQQHAADIVTALEDAQFWPHFGIASVPANSPYFRPLGFWNGPVWVNINWLLIEGLERYGYHETAHRLRQSTLEMIAKNDGMYEFYSPIDATPVGTPNFSWTAALVIDMLERG